MQGCSDSGGLPNVYTAYQSVADPAIKQKFESEWRTDLNDQPGLTVTEMVDGALTGQIKAMVVMGENPMMSEPNLSHAQHALEELDLLVCIDIFMNETGEMADVILPSASFAEKEGTFTNSDRRIQRVRQALPAVGESLPDWQIICDLAKRMEAQLGVAVSAGFDYQHPEEIWEEMRRVTPDFFGVSYARLEEEGGVHWPCPAADHPGTPYLFEDDFPRGKGKFWELEYGTESELPDEEYPYHLTTGRVLFHWHGGTMTRSSRLEEAFPVPIIEMHPADAGQLRVVSGDWLRITSRRGTVECQVMVTGRSPAGHGLFALPLRRSCSEPADPGQDRSARQDSRFQDGGGPTGEGGSDGRPAGRTGRHQGSDAVLCIRAVHVTNADFFHCVTNKCYDVDGRSCGHERDASDTYSG